MRKISPISKLLVGLCLLWLSEKVTCGPTLAEEQIPKRMKAEIDQLFYEILNCSTGVADEFMSCILRETDIKRGVSCSNLKVAWRCVKVGVLQCEDGYETLRWVAPKADNSSILRGCPPINLMSDEDEDSGQQSSHSMIPIFVLILLVCLVITVFFI